MNCPECNSIDLFKEECCVEVRWLGNEKTSHGHMWQCQDCLCEFITGRGVKTIISEGIEELK